MPLIKRSSKAARATNIRRLIDEGYPPRQAVAIAYATQRAARNRAGGSMGAKAHRDAAIEAEKATRAQSGAAAVASSRAASDHARAAEAAAKASDSRTDFRAAAQAHDAAASAAWLVGDSARSERHTNAMDRAWRAATRAVNAAGGRRRNRAGGDLYEAIKSAFPSMRTQARRAYGDVFISERDGGLAGRVNVWQTPAGQVWTASNATIRNRLREAGLGALEASARR
ncbi:MAG: hypothetical protein RIS45_373 [Planctomycetota bacterium]|jgi:hypothetical protein